TVVGKKGSAQIVTTFTGDFGIDLITTLDSSGNGGGYEVIVGDIYFRYSYNGKTHTGNEPYFEKASNLSIHNGSFSVSEKADTIILGVTATDTITGTVTGNRQQISENVNIVFNTTYLGVNFTGNIAGSGTLTAPALTISGTADSNTTDVLSVRPFANVTVSDFNVGQTDTVTVTMSNPANGTLSNLGGGSYNQATGVYTVSGSADSVTAALQGLEFNPTRHQAPAGQIVTTKFTIGAKDSAGASANGASNVYTTETQSAPVLSGAGNSINYLPGAAAVTLDPNLTVADPVNQTLAGATVTIGTGFVSGDTLGFVNQTKISGSYNAATGVLTLTGTDTLANYQAALQSITFSTSSADPSASGTDLRRSIVWTVNDGSQSSTPVGTTVVIGIPATVRDGQTQIVSSGQTAYGTVVQSGGEQIVESGGTALGTNVSPGGKIVYGGGTVK
ncbi:MAG TPA: hypothetical protein VKT80_19605, partial [Chloroflexota bacterium]|nr:hypothetical protein [Chloroflexota bacterium]